MTATALDRDLRSACAGVVALPGRLEPWQAEVLGRPGPLDDWLAEYGSPANILDPAPMARNARELTDAAAAYGVDLDIFFARKANKALAFVDAARALEMGVDLASEAELTQVLELGIPGSRLVMTAAVKPASLLRLCIESGTTIAVDNDDELDLLAALSGEAGRDATIALRLAPDLGRGRLETRFGFPPQAALAAVDRRAGQGTGLVVAGVHFHLDGYSPADRVRAIGQGLGLVDALRERGHAPAFVDIGGGVPMSYLESGNDWRRFWVEHRRALAGAGRSLTFENHAIRQVYPYHQELVRGRWLEAVLAAPLAVGGSVAAAVRSRGLQLRCEPGRSLLDGCGLTLARVEFRKQRRDGTWLIGLAMNRTQCRSTSDDFMVDPIVVPGAGSTGEGTGPIEGYLVGAYCIERELLTWRRLRFPHGVRVGDVVAFPNTAGYLMHILESSSHQIPLARNLVMGHGPSPRLDAIDAECRLA